MTTATSVLPAHLRAQFVRLRPGVPAIPVPDGTVQIGFVNHHRLRLRPPESLDQSGCLMLLSLLGAGRTLRQLRETAELRGARPSVVDELLIKLESAGLLAGRTEHPLRAHLHGRGPITEALNAELAASGARVTTSQGFPLRRGVAEHRPELVILADQLAPDPAVVHQLLAARVPHLRIRLVDGGGHIGPLVLPGRTGCLWCEQQHAADEDPMWPELLRHIGTTAGHAEPQVRQAVLAQATAEINHIARFLRAKRPVPPPRTLGAVVELSHDGVLSPPQRTPAHPDCLFHSVLSHRQLPPTPRVCPYPVRARPHYDPQIGRESQIRTVR